MHIYIHTTYIHYIHTYTYIHTQTYIHIYTYIHTYIHTCMHTYITVSKIAGDVSLQIDNALNAIVSFTDKSGNLKKLKYEIHETASHLRNLVVTLKCELLEKTEENIKMSVEFKEFKDALEKSTTSSRLVATSVTCNKILTIGGKVFTAPPYCDTKKLFSEVVGGKHEERYKLTLKTKANQSKEEIKKLLKTKIDSINMKIGIRAFKSLKNVRSSSKLTARKS